MFLSSVYAPSFEWMRSETTRYDDTFWDTSKKQSALQDNKAILLYGMSRMSELATVKLQPASRAYVSMATFFIINYTQLRTLRKEELHSKS